MLARELVSILEENNPDYSRVALLQEIEYVQREVLSSPNMLTKAVDTSTGLDPVITPTTEEWTIPNASTISRVYESDYSLPKNVVIQGNTIYFQTGDLNRDYYVRYYKAMPRLTSESMELTIPDDVISYLEDGVEARLSSKEHGSKEEWRYWRKRELPQLRSRLNNSYKWKYPETRTRKYYE